jgi:preprotein translocase subunit SecG
VLDAPPCLLGIHRRTVAARRLGAGACGSSGYTRAVVAGLAILQVLLSFALVTLILMHSGRDAGMGGMGFTPASHGGTHIVERNLTRLTIVVAIVWFGVGLALFKSL